MENQENVHKISGIVAVRNPAEYLFYVDNLSNADAQAVFNPQNTTLTLSFPKRFYDSCYSADIVREFLSSEDRTVVMPRTRSVRASVPDIDSWTKEEKENTSPYFYPMRLEKRIRDESTIDLNSQFGEREFPVLRKFPHYTSILQGAILLGFDIEKEGIKFGIITDTDIWPKEGSRCFGLEGYALGTADQVCPIR